MPFPLTLTTADGAVPYRLLVPTRWADVTLAQYVALFAPEATDARSPIEILCGLEVDTLERLSVHAVQHIGNLLAFAADPGPVLELLPTPGLPDVGALSYGTLLLAQQHLEAHAGRPELASLPYLLALYRCQAVWGKYSETRTAACLAALLTAPVTESYADAAFFLRACRAFSLGTPPTNPMATSRKTKSTKRGWKRWAKGLGRFWASIPRPVALS